MYLTREALENKEFWAKAQVALASFDLAAIDDPANPPAWVHFGAGNIFRGYIACLQQKLLEQGLTRQGLVAVECFDPEIIDRIYRPWDNLALLVTLLPDGSTRREIIASVSRALAVEASGGAARQELESIFRRPQLQLASFTITEKGYALEDLQGELLPQVRADLAAGPGRGQHVMSLLTGLLWARYQAGAWPLALVSMDNCSHNGEKLRRSVLQVAAGWQEQGWVEDGFIAYLQDEARVAFPWTMIDKIVPRPAEEVGAALAAAGIEGMAAVITGRNTYIAPFVNAEAPQYLVVEDNFPNGRPPLEAAGVCFTDRDTVNKAERMKVTTCLNPLHTALAVFGCLLGFSRVWQEMEDPDLRALAEMIGCREGMPVVVDPGVIDPRAFLREVLEQRLPNPFIPDAPQRIATDSSQKIPIRFGETIKSYLAHPQLEADSLTAIPLAIAAWLRYLLAVDDQGQPMSLSPDPLLAQLQGQLAGVKLGQPDSLGDQLRPILTNPVLFATDLAAAGLEDKITAMFRSMLAGPGAVRATLRSYLAANL